MLYTTLNLKDDSCHKGPFSRRKVEIMEILKDYEKKVLSLLVSSVFSTEKLSRIIRESKLIGYEYTGSGYFLKISHSLLPNESIVCELPIVIGEADGITCGFIIYIDNHQLTIECHSWGELNVTEDFRDKDVQIRTVTIEEGKFVDLKTVAQRTLFATFSDSIKI